MKAEIVYEMRSGDEVEFYVQLSKEVSLSLIPPLDTRLMITPSSLKTDEERAEYDKLFERDEAPVTGIFRIDSIVYMVNEDVVTLNTGEYFESVDELNNARQQLLLLYGFVEDYPGEYVQDDL